jgi:nitronate monooxygenase
MQSEFARRFGLEWPIVQAPMAGANATPPALVGAVSGAGALGCIGAAYMSPTEIAATCRGVRDLTNRPFGINLFAPIASPPVPSDVATALARVAPAHAALGLPAPTLPDPPAFTFADQLAAALDGGAAFFSFTFGLLPLAAVDAIKARGLYLAGTATTVEEAVALERAGVDAIVAQGSEAASHRGSFAGLFESSMIGTVALVPQIVDAVTVPVVASGGIMDGRGIVAALALGARAVQMGTAFLACDECGIAPSYKDAVLRAHEDQTRVTRAFSGRPARGIVNRFMTDVDRTGAPGDASAILPFPYQNRLTRALRAAASAQDRSEFLSLWAGQGVRMARRQSARDLVRRLGEEMGEVLRRLAISDQRLANS